MTNIDRITETIEKGKSIYITILYKSGTKRKYKYPYNTLPGTANIFINKSYVYFISPCEKLYKLNHD